MGWNLSICFLSLFVLFGFQGGVSEDARAGKAVGLSGGDVREAGGGPLTETHRFRPNDGGGGESSSLKRLRVEALRDELSAAEQTVRDLKVLLAEAEADLGAG